MDSSGSVPCSSREPLVQDVRESADSEGESRTLELISRRPQELSQQVHSWRRLRIGGFLGLGFVVAATWVFTQSGWRLGVSSSGSRSHMQTKQLFMGASNTHSGDSWRSNGGGYWSSNVTPPAHLVRGSEGECMDDCANDSNDWAEKCWWVKCENCGACDTAQFSCKTGDTEPNADWPALKRSLCCKKEGWGCPKNAHHHSNDNAEQEFDASQTSVGPIKSSRSRGGDKDCIPKPVSHSTNGSSPGHHQKHHGIEAAGSPRSSNEGAIHFDCNPDVGDWQKDWSDLKKSACCQRIGVGCSGNHTDAKADPVGDGGGGGPTKYCEDNDASDGENVNTGAGQNEHHDSTSSPRSRGMSKGLPHKPNIIFIVTDGQDQYLGGSFPPTTGLTPMPKTRHLMYNKGVHATNWYAHTPLCTPSRAEILTGRYFHNVKAREFYMHVNQSVLYDSSFPKFLKEQAGYTTGLFGKFIDKIPDGLPPPGFDAWLAYDGAKYIGPTFFTYGIDGLAANYGNAKFTWRYGGYSTSVIGNVSISWIKQAAKKSKPFMAYIAPNAPAEPFVPAPWYVDYWDPSWPIQEPRPANWNSSMESRKFHHGNIASQPLLTEQAADMISGVFKNRWRTLMSVDDLVEGIVNVVHDLGLVDSTYIFYTTTHGYNLGQFNLLMDARQAYEWNTKIHLLAIGPGVVPRSSFGAAGTVVDIAPTLLGLAGIKQPETMDGKSIAPFLFHSPGELLHSTWDHFRHLGPEALYAETWRTDVFFQYHYAGVRPYCPAGLSSTLGRTCGPGVYPIADTACANLKANMDCWCFHAVENQSPCYPTEDPQNNFLGLRQGDLLYTEFQAGLYNDDVATFDRIDFYEFFNVANDPWQTDNKARFGSWNFGDQHVALHKRLLVWKNCSGATCP